MIGWFGRRTSNKIEGNNMNISNVSIGGSGGTVTINGRTLKFAGNNVYVDGILYTPANKGEAVEMPDLSPKSLKFDKGATIEGELRLLLKAPYITLLR